MLIPHWILYGWVALAGLSTLYVAWDGLVRGNPENTVMKWGWILITLYIRPVATPPYHVLSTTRTIMALKRSVSTER